MALSLPLNFGRDIQGKDTAIFPVIRIGNYLTTNYIWLSTNVSTIEDHNILPLLLNIPSLKESIDIEKRNYKISSINIDISNYEYIGKRFSERVAELNEPGISKSLANVECRVFWVSPSVVRFITEESTTIEDDQAMQVYNGFIRRYTHDDEKVQLVVEDRSQATLHDNLPKANVEVENVPNKYKNKPIPMVYGIVDKSPMVIKTAPTETNWGTGNIEILADSDNDAIIASGLGSVTIFANDTYLSIPSTININQSIDGNDSSDTIGNIFNFTDGTPQFDRAQNLIRLSTSGSWEDPNPSPIFLNKIVGIDVTSSDQFIYSPLNQISTYWTDKVIHEPHKGRSWYGTIQHGNEFAGSLLLEEDRDDWQGESFIHSMPPAENGGSWSTNADIEIYDFLYNEPSGDDDHHERAMMGCSVQTGTVATTAFSEHLSMVYYDIGLAVGSGYNYSGDDDKRLRLRVGGNNEGDTGQGGNIDQPIWISSIGDSGPIGEQWHPQTDPLLSGWTLIDTPENLLIYLRITGHNGWSHMAGKIKIKDLQLYHFALVEDLLNLDFYATVIGRMGSDNKADEIIADILIRELGIDGVHSDFTINSNPYIWYYDFTVDKKINSKKLIEGIASASPYIPRFNNMGNFKFDVIRPTYEATTDAANTTILGSDVINFTFSRTPIEDVKTAIKLEYSYEYARDGFSRNLQNSNDENGAGFFNEVMAIEDILTSEGDGYSNEYYGFKEDHSESTLIIDDDRGKYIRNDITAYSFAKWMLLWSCNQHLKIKVKLPLKYINLEIGDIVEFNETLGGVLPYGINYKQGSVVDDLSGDIVNGQQVFPFFMILSTNKTLEWIEIECIQMHNLAGEIIEAPPELFTESKNFCVSPQTLWSEYDATEWGITYEFMLDPDGMGYPPSFTPPFDGNGDIDFSAFFYHPDGPDTHVGQGVNSKYTPATANDVPSDHQQYFNEDFWWEIQDAGNMPTLVSNACNVPGPGIPSPQSFELEIAVDEGQNPPWYTFINNKEGGYFHSLYQHTFSSDGANDTTAVEITGPGFFQRILAVYLMTGDECEEEQECWLADPPYIMIKIKNIVYQNTQSLTGFSVSHGMDDVGIGSYQTTDDDEDYTTPQISSLLSNYEQVFEIPFDISLDSPNWVIDDGGVEPSPNDYAVLHLDVQLGSYFPEIISTLHLLVKFIYREDCSFYIGDVDYNMFWNVLDMVQLANCVLTSTCHELEYPCTADINSDGTYNVLDVVQLANCVLNGTCSEGQAGG